MSKTLKFHYETPAELRRLLETISENSVELTVWMNAVVPDEFHTLWEKLHPSLADTRFGEGEHLRRARFAEDLQRLVELAHKERVMPYTEFVSHSGYDLKVKYGDGYPYTAPEEIRDLFERLQHPLFVAQGWRFYLIRMGDTDSEDSIKKIKEVALGLPPDKYVIKHIKAGLNPRTHGGNGYDYTEHDAELSAGKGIVTLTIEREDAIDQVVDQMTLKLGEQGIKPLTIENLHGFLAKYLGLQKV